MRAQRRRNVSLRWKCFAKPLRASVMLVVLSLQLVTQGLCMSVYVRVCVCKRETMSDLSGICISAGCEDTFAVCVCAERCAAQMCVGGLCGSTGRLKMLKSVSHKVGKIAWAYEATFFLFQPYCNKVKPQMYCNNIRCKHHPVWLLSITMHLLIRHILESNAFKAFNCVQSNYLNGSLHSYYYE